MESPSDNELYHTGEESSDDGYESNDQNYSGDGSDCDDDNRNNAPTSHRLPRNKKGKAAMASTKASVKVTVKPSMKPSTKAYKKSHNNISMDESTPPPSDFSNLKDHYAESHCIAFNARFFEKKCVVMKCARQGKNAIAYTMW